MNLFWIGADTVGYSTEEHPFVRIDGGCWAEIDGRKWDGFGFETDKTFNKFTLD